VLEREENTLVEVPNTQLGEDDELFIDIVVEAAMI
jgi:hypothetical protein